MDHSSQPRKVAVLTGVTGFLGSKEMKDLVDKGYTVIAIARDEVVKEKREGKWEPTGETVSANTRVKNMCRDLGMDDEQAGRVYGVEGNLAALKPEDLQEQIQDIMHEIHADNIEVFINCAANLNMEYEGQSPEKIDGIRKKNYQTNVEGVRGLTQAVDGLEASGISVSRFIQVSTAYVHKRETGDLKEEFVPAYDPENRAPNSYPQTKLLGEAVLKEWTDKRKEEGNPMPLDIVRPSIVVGPDTRDGYVAFINLLSKEVKVPEWLRAGSHIFPEDLWKRLPVNLREEHCRVADILRVGAIAMRFASERNIPLTNWKTPDLKLMMPGNPDAHLDLIRDTDVVKYLGKIVESGVPDPQEGVRITQIADGDGISLRDIKKMTLEAFGWSEDEMEVVSITDPETYEEWMKTEGKNNPVAAYLDKNLFAYTKMLWDYMASDEGTRFSTTEITDLLKDKGGYNPEGVTKQYVEDELMHRGEAKQAPEGQAAASGEGTGMLT